MIFDQTRVFSKIVDKPNTEETHWSNDHDRF